MYNLLIVDDEKIIREGLFELLSMEEELELNLFSAASAIEAREILEERKIDIVLTDIKMPKMSGIELFDVIQERWPHCKVIFLTGYSEFDYVYKVHKHARYILKAEEDEKIIAAVSETVREIENDFMLEQIVRDSDLLLDQKKEREKDRFLYDLFSGFTDTSTVTDDLISRLGIDLTVSEGIYYAVMRHDPIGGNSYDEQLQILADLQLLMEKYYFDFMKGIVFHHSKNYIIMLLQPTKWNTPERNLLTLKGRSELFQKACLKNFDMTLSILLGGGTLPLGEFTGRFHRIKSKLLMAGEEALLILKETPEDISDRDFQREQKENLIESRLELLDYYFENSHGDHVMALLNEASELFEDKSDMEDLFAVEVFSDIAVKLLKYINRLHLSEESRNRVEIARLYSVTAYESWREAFHYLREVCEFVFELREASRTKSNDDVIRQVKGYIHDNLSGDTSLDTLADLVRLSPEYLLRRFKKSEGVTILQFINDLKIIKAKSLIADKNRQIKEIAFELGFSSSGYFGRFFKSKTGLSPQGYRDQLA